ncbi:MAG: Pycsar system effector family protein [Parcubacteria group bacterium]|jgi:hypothetical protein
MEQLKFIHNTIIHWIDKTDSKANIILALKLFILGYFLKEFHIQDVEKFKQFILFIFFFSSALSFFFVLKIVYPKLSTGEASSLLYFKHISDKYKFNKKQGAADYKNLTPDKLELDTINQIISLSIVATEKYRDLQKSIILLFVEVISLTILFL